MKKKTKKIIVGVILFFIFALAFFVRVYPPYEKVFNPELPEGWIGYAADDAVYHMRIVENSLLGGHFPKRIYFDPYTHFPYGTYIHFAPLYTWLLAGPVWIASAGRPTLELINKIAPYIPVLLGCLMVFVAYIAGQALFDKKTGLLAAFLMAFSPPFLYRSLLGNADHHVAEVLLSSLTVVFLILALKKYSHPDSKKTKGPVPIRCCSRDSSPRLKSGAQNDKSSKSFWLYTILAGISFGLYFLSWVGALIFAFIIGVFILVYYLAEYCCKPKILDSSSDYSRRSRSNNNDTSPQNLFFDQVPTLVGARGEAPGQSPSWILKMGAVIFFIPLLMIAPFLNHPDIFRSPLYNIKHLISLALGIAAFIFIGWLGKLIKKKKWPVWLLPVLLIAGTILALAAIKIILPALFNIFSEMLSSVNKGMVSKPAARVIVSEMAPLRLPGAIGSFGAFFFLAIISFFIVAFLFFKKREPKYLFVIIWALSIALLCGILPSLGQQRNSPYLSLIISLLAAFAIISALRFGWQGIKIAKNAPRDSKMRLLLLFGSAAVLLISFLALVYPFPLNILNPAPANLPDIFSKAINVAKRGPAGPPLEEHEWYGALIWLKENTPNPGLDYFELYKQPGVDQKTGQINPYPYPEQAYGVLSRWDVGHMITYYAHRIPVANPFQQGLGDITKEGIIPGSTVFFTETDEKKAAQYLQALGAKYIVTDISISNPTGMFNSFLNWLEVDAEQYYASSTDPSRFDRSMIARLHLLDGTSFSKNGQMLLPLEHFRLIYESAKRGGYSKEKPENEIKTIKIFEYVKGAKIIGQTSPGALAAISTKITTNQNRTFVYKNSAKADKAGMFQFTIPYPGSYKIQIGTRELEKNITEQDVTKGKIIQVK